jgi:hypothetical protein
MNLSRLLALYLFLFSPPSLHAQLGLYGAFTVQNLGVPNDNGYGFYGGTFGAYLASGRLAILSLGVDLRGSFTKDGGDSFDSGSIGPRLALNTHILPILPIHPYVEGTVGLGSLNLAGGSPSNGFKFEYQVLGGLDFTVFPRVDWRIAEYSYGGLSSLNNFNFHPKSLSSGLVLRLPRFLPLP